MYVAANDVSSRDLQKHHSQWFKGKTLDRLLPSLPSLPTLPTLPSLLSSHRLYTFIIYNSLKRTSLSCLTHPRIYYVQSLISNPPLPSPTVTTFPPPSPSPLFHPPRSCPLGPCIVPHSEIPSSAFLAPHGHPDLTLKLWLNGEW